MIIRFWLILLTLVGVNLFYFGCSGSNNDSTSSAGTANCELFTGDNCWKDILQEASACAHDSSVTCVISADGSTCTYIDGTVITFANPLDLDNDTYMSDYEWDFTITINEETCLTYSNTDTASVLTTQSGTFSDASSNGGMSYSITCPDGTRYSTSNSFSLLECLDSLPGYSYVRTSSSLSFSLTGASDGELMLFSGETE